MKVGISLVLVSFYEYNNAYFFYTNLSDSDAICLDCDATSITPLVFETSAMNITLESTDLILEVEGPEAGDKLCFVKLQPSPIYMSGW